MTKAGFEVSRLAYGTWRLLADKPTAQEVNRRLHLCLELGITTIDTAEIYGKYGVEALLGEALALSPGLREQLEIVTATTNQLRPKWNSRTVESGWQRYRRCTQHRPNGLKRAVTGRLTTRRDIRRGG